MKKLLAAITLFSSAFVFAKDAIDIQKIKTIICQATYYYEDYDINKTPTSGIKIFKTGSRKDVPYSKGAFLLSEFDIAEDGNLKEFGNQQYYLRSDEDGKIVFEFLAGWKANGELKINNNGSATGFINQKGHVTDLSCVIKN